ncbi:MAG: 1,4-dihydroxy-2-naphthoate polyprenyltransferase [Gemmatimonadales bacterium]
MSRVRAWAIAARPRTLPAAAAPVLVGTALAWEARGLAPLPALAALVGALLLQVGSNFANDVYDYEKGADTDARLGPLRVTQAGLLTASDVKRGMWTVFGCATLVGAYLAWIAGWPVVVIGLASIAAAVAYTGGPLPFGYRGLGDLFVMIFFGFVAVCGTAYVQVGRVPKAAWPAGLMVGCLATAILVVNNVRDHETDRIARKRTLPVVLGRGAGVAEYGGLLIGAYVTAWWMVWRGLTSPWTLLAFLTFPVAVVLIVHLRKYRGPVLNSTLAHTAQLLFLYCLLYSAGVVAGGV